MLYFNGIYDCYVLSDKKHRASEMFLFMFCTETMPIGSLKNSKFTFDTSDSYYAGKQKRNKTQKAIHSRHAQLYQIYLPLFQVMLFSDVRPSYAVF